MKRSRRILTRILILFSALVLVFAITVPLVLSPKRLTPIVNRVVPKYIHANIAVEKAAISLLKHFPFISVTLHNGSIILPDFYPPIPQADTFFSFSYLEASLKPLQLLKGTLNVGSAKLENAFMYLCEQPDGRTNWDIFGSSSPEDPTSQEFFLRVGELDMTQHIRFAYHNVTDTVFFGTIVNKGHLKIRTFSDIFSASIDAPENTLVTGADTLFNRTSLRLEGGLGFGLKPRHGNVSMDFDEYIFKECQGALGTVPLLLDGWMGLRTDSLELHASVQMDSCLLNEVLDVAGGFILKDSLAVESSLPLSLHMKLDGAYYYDTGALPPFDFTLKAGEGSVHHIPSRINIPHVLADLTASYNPKKEDYGNMDIRQLDISSNAFDIKAQGSITSFLSQPEFDIKMQGKLNADSLAHLFVEKERAVVQGTLTMEAAAKCRWDDLSFDRIGNTTLNADIDSDHFRLMLPTDSIMIYADSTCFRFNVAPGKDLKVNLDCDSLNILLKYKYIARLSSTKLEAAGASEALAQDTSKIQRIQGKFKSHYLDFQTADSTRIRMGNATAAFSLKPDSLNTTVPLVHLDMKAKSMGVKYGFHRALMSETDLNLNLKLNPDEKLRTQRREKMLDSLQKIYPEVARDSLMQHNRIINPADTLRRTRPGGLLRPVRERLIRDELSYTDIDLGLERSTRELLRTWEADGHIKASMLGVITPYFPIRTTLNGVNIRLNSDYIDVNNTKIQTGKSDILLTGRLSNLKNALQKRGKIGVFVDLQSDLLDCNEIIEAVNAGGTFQQQQATVQLQELREQLLANDSDAAAQQLISQSAQGESAENTLIIVPGNLDLQAVLAVSKASFMKFQFKGMHGMLRAADRVLQLDQLMASTNAGDLCMDALYSTPNKQDIKVGFDMELKQMHLEEAITLLPSLDTLFPMLQSFRGTTDLQIAAASNLDTNMNFVLSSLSAACRIHGKDMVLLDGETFTEISDKLMFRNKDRNVIDSIGVEVTIADSEINVYPFAMSLDRYKAAVSGTHNLDMSFNYHISIIESPLPFRLGVNVTGTIDKPKINVGKCLYKDSNLPSYSYKIDSVRMNLRDVITGHFKDYSFK